MSKRMYESETQSSNSSHKRCNISQSQTMITIDHTASEDHHYHQTVLNGSALDDDLTNIKFIVDNVEIPAHRQVINILKGKRQLVRDAIEKDERNAQKEQTEAATIFQMSGTTPKGFQKLLEYIYTGKVVCDLNTAIELANTGHKLKFHPLVATLAQHLAENQNNCLTLKLVDDLYHIAKGAENKDLLKSCRKFMDEKAYDLNNLFIKREQLNTDPKNVLIFAFDKSRYINYIHFLIPEKYEICFTLSVSTDRTNWMVVLKNDDIWSKFWNWVYFEEKRIKYIKITFTDLKDGQKFNNREIRDDQFLAKRANIDLEFDGSTGYLIPKHDIIKFPIRDTKYLFDEQLKTYTYCISKSSAKDKLKEYYYHNIGDNKFLEFYLSQTCLIDSFRIWLWDNDDRTYDFRVEVKSEKEEDYTLIKEGSNNIFKNKSSWQTIDLRGRRAVRWIRITGLRGPVHDTEFAVVDIDCPALPKKLKLDCF